MSEPQKFDIVFTGDIADGISFDQVKQKAAELFKLNNEKVNQLFQSKPVKLKKNLDQAAAEKYQKILASIGMIVQIKAQASPNTNHKKTSATEVNQQTIQQPIKTPPSEQWELAEPGARLSDPINSRPIAIPESQLTIAPQEGNILKSEERAAPSPEPKLPGLGQLSLGEKGEDLLYANEKIDELDLEIDISHLSVEELGGYLLKEGERTIFVAKDIDVSGVRLVGSE